MAIPIDFIPPTAMPLKLVKDKVRLLKAVIPASAALAKDVTKVLCKSLVANAITAIERRLTHVMTVSNGIDVKAFPKDFTVSTMGVQSYATSISTPFFSSGRNASAMFCNAVTKLSFSVEMRPCKVWLCDSRFP